MFLQTLLRRLPDVCQYNFNFWQKYLPFWCEQLDYICYCFRPQSHSTILLNFQDLPQNNSIVHRPILFFYRHFSVITWCYINPTWSAERTHLFQPDRNNQIIVSVLMDYLLFPTDLTENSFRSGRIRSVSSDWCGYIKYFDDQADCSAIVLIINGILGSM